MKLRSNQFIGPLYLITFKDINWMRDMIAQQQVNYDHSNASPFQMNNKFNLMKTRRVDFEGKRQRPHSTPKKDEKSQGQVNFLQKKVKRGNEVLQLCKMGKYEKIPFIPEIKLSIKDMNDDPLILIMKLQVKYSNFGAVKLITPPEWNPPICLKSSKIDITTRIQKLHELKIGRSFEEKKQAYSLEQFYNMAINFQRKYKYKFEEEKSSPLCRLENEYWSLIEGVGPEEEQKFPKKYKVTVEYAADLPASRYGSGFPKQNCSKYNDPNFNYADNLFNLNNVYRSQCSLLKISDLKREYIGGITIPWIYMGMMFSTFCWHVQDCNINSINYNHQGAVKIWYIIPEEDKDKFERFVLQKFNGKDVLGKITVMIDPLDLIRYGIRVFKTYHRPGQYVCTFFKTYHCGFSEGFNIGEAVNFVTADSLKQIRKVIEHQPSKGTLFCYEWLIYENYLNGLKATIIKEYQELLAKEEKQLNYLLKRMNINKLQVVEEKVKYDRWCCCKCKRYVFLSFLQCEKCKKCFCLSEAQKCCDKSQMILMSRVPNLDRQPFITQLQRSIKND